MWFNLSATREGETVYLDLYDINYPAHQKYLYCSNLPGTREELNSIHKLEEYDIE
jgi:hypothetical protein